MLSELSAGPIIGIDINGRRFSYAVLSNGEVVDKGVVEPSDLIKLIKRVRPRALAIDSISELLELAPSVIKGIGKLPFTVSIVQVTRVKPDREETMEYLARNYLGLNITKLDPDTTAEVAARLCAMGIGSLVRVYEPETRIVIKASVSTTPGGMSRNRYMRNVMHRIKYLAKEVKEVLEKNNIDYDVFRTDSEGIRSVVFIAYADKSRVRSLIKPRRSMDVKLTIESVPSDSIRYVGLDEDYEIEGLKQTKGRHLIVGVDPGIVTGLAIMDLEGNVLSLHSGKNLSRRHALRIIYQYGTPVLIAVDTVKPSEYAKKLAAMVGAALYYPERDLSIAEKSKIALELSREQGVNVKDPHMRDALAAAYKAFTKIKPKLDKVEEEVQRVIRESIDEVKALVIKGLSVKQAIDEVSKRVSINQPVEVKVVTTEKGNCECRDVREEYERIISTLQGEVDRLNKLYLEAKNKLEELINNYDVEARRDQLIRSLEARLNILESELEKYKLKVRSYMESIDNMRRGIYDYVNGDNYLVIRLSENMNLNKIAKLPNIIPALTLNEILNVGIDELIRRGINTVLVLGDNVDKNAVKPLWKRGLRAIPIRMVMGNDDEIFVRKGMIDSLISKLEGELLREVDEDYLRRLINEYRNLNRTT
ncbi:DUF460 domain-containing protein [Vulcanisaeta thermophila]|uniref:DUF460 domain-containing protein n=1 Tax=Vulcanisaeta thermophila TaxID=867917 RepID=UPI000853796F|nr:DUF460 domain-containing protein [Vulcanisaeta thermophila]